MPEFDPYHRWLSISPEEQPPNHYRLLGVKPFESDPDAIESAADRQMAHVRSFQTGKHATWSQKLLNELSVAKVCLLAPAQKAAYDSELRAKLIAAAPPIAKPPAVKLEHGVARSLPKAKPIAPAIAPAPVTEKSAGLGFDPFAERGPARRPTQKKSSLPLPVLIAGGVGLVVAAAAAFFVIRGGGDEPSDGKTQPVADRSGGSATDRPVARAEAPAPTDRSNTSRQADEESRDERSTTSSDTAAAQSKVSPKERDSVEAARSTDLPAKATAPDSPEDAAPAAMDLPPAAERPVADVEPKDKGPLADPEALARIASEIKEAYADDYARAKSRDQKGSLARKLLAQSGKANEPETRFGLMDQARQLATASGDYELALEAIAALSATYRVDGVALKCEALTAAAPAARGAQRTMLSGAAMRLADEALDAAHFEQAQAMAKLALSLARGAKDVALVKSATAAVKQVNELVPIYREAQKAIVTLESNPDDAEANLSGGKLLCLVKWDWPRGLPLLAKGSNLELQALARRELEPIAAPEASADLADGWWDVAKHSRGYEKFDLEQHAGQLYLRAVDQLTGPRKQTAERRIKELADKFPSEPPAAGSGLIPATNEFAARQAQRPTLPPGVCPEDKLPELLGQWSPGFSVKWTGIEVFPEYFGRKNALRTHPGAEDKPGTFFGRVKVPARMHTRFELTVASAEEGDWDLIVQVNDRIVHKSTIDMRSAKGWRDVTVDLTPFAGQTVELQAMNKNTGWFYEWGYWERIAIVTSR